MKTVAKALVLAMAMSLTATMSIYAQGVQVKAKVPFSFEAAGKVLPAGEYTFTVDDPDSPAIVTVKSQDGSKLELMLTEEQDMTEAANESKVVFEKYGDRAFLSQVWVSGESVVEVVPNSEIQKELAQNARQHETVSVKARTP